MGAVAHTSLRHAHLISRSLVTRLVLLSCLMVQPEAPFCSTGAAPARKWRVRIGHRWRRHRRAGDSRRGAHQEAAPRVCGAQSLGAEARGAQGECGAALDAGAGVACRGEGRAPAQGGCAAPRPSLAPLLSLLLSAPPLPHSQQACVLPAGNTSVSCAASTVMSPPSSSVRGSTSQVPLGRGRSGHVGKNARHHALLLGGRHHCKARVVLRVCRGKGVWQGVAG